MNELDTFDLNTPNYRYGFLAAALPRTLARPLGARLTSEDCRLLSLARTFLSNVLDGARLVSKGETQAVSATQAMGALGYALGPLQAMEQLKTLSQDNLLTLFGRMLESVDLSITEGNLAGNEEALQIAAAFFSYLNQSILSTLNAESHSSTSKAGVT
ncbi:MAG TPA: hypothetical protein VF944_11920 [Candidatus Bathyarchaeia archaeon]